LTKKSNDHGGGLDGAARQYGGNRTDWIDLSTGINPLPYGVSGIQPDAWTALPDQTAATNLTDAARAFWNVPDTAAILAAPGASSLIANMPRLAPTASVDITGPTYNEHASAFEMAQLLRKSLFTPTTLTAASGRLIRSKRRYVLSTRAFAM
jgi:cobalamin biosynthetic protein CobC